MDVAYIKAWSYGAGVGFTMVLKAQPSPNSGVTEVDPEIRTGS